MRILIFLISVFVEFYFLNQMLVPKPGPVPAFVGLAAINALVSYINVDCGLYLVFPQEILFLLSSILSLHLFYNGKSGKRLMLAIFIDGIGNTATFLFLPTIHYVSGFMEVSQLSHFLYDVCTILTLSFLGITYHWIAKKYRNLQGAIAPAGNFYLLILAFFVKCAVTYYGTAQLDSGHYSLVSVICITLAAVIGVMILLFSLYYVDRRLILALSTQQNEFLEKQMEIWKEHEKQSAAFRHDLKNHFLCLESLLHSGHNPEAEAYLNEITHRVTSFSSEFSTGNVYADAVLREKLALAEAGSIDLETDMIFPPADQFPPVDLCIILSNGLDNAIEACKRLPEANTERRIKALSYVRHSCLMIEIINPLPPSQKEGPTLLKSTKQNTELHGIGLSNVLQAVERHHGTMEVNARSGSFCFYVMLPLKASCYQT